MDFRSPWVISLSSLPHQEGAHITWEREIDAPEDFGTELLAARPGSQIYASCTLTSVSEGVLVSGTGEVELVGQCSRCLTPLEEHRSETFNELVLYPSRRQALIDEGDEDAEEMPVVQDDHIDIEGIVRDAIVSSIDFTPLCRPDCPGLCAVCGLPWDELPDDHHHEALNPAFDALAGLEAMLQSESDSEGASASDQANGGESPQ